MTPETNTHSFKKKAEYRQITNYNYQYLRQKPKIMTEK